MSHQIVVWGDQSAGQGSSPPDRFGFEQVLPGGAAQTIAIRMNGSVELWGQGSIPPPSYPYFQFPPVRGGAIGSTHFVGILTADGSLLSCGNFMSVGSAIPPPLRGVKAVAVGSDHGCAIDTNDQLQRWGDPTMTPPPPGKFKMIRARSNYTIAIRDDDRLYGWGGVFDTPAVLQWDGWAKKRDNDGYAYAPGPFKEIAAGPKSNNPLPHILAIDTSDAIHGWGQDESGQATGQPTGKFTAIGAGLSYSIALDENYHLQFWGKNWGADDPESPLLVGLANVPMGRFGSISAGSRHATALRLVFETTADMTLTRPKLVGP